MNKTRSIYLDDSLLIAVQKWAKNKGLNFNKAVVELLQLGLGMNGASEIEELRIEVNRIKKVLRDKGVEI